MDREVFIVIENHDNGMNYEDHFYSDEPIACAISEEIANKYIQSRKLELIRNFGSCKIVNTPSYLMSGAADYISFEYDDVYREAYSDGSGEHFSWNIIKLDLLES